LLRRDHAGRATPAVDLHRLDEHVGRLAPVEQRAVDEALELVLGL
jgi:mRNA-degrading endonuclease toxin of MazEF toxin-antitoxin module